MKIKVILNLIWKSVVLFFIKLQEIILKIVDKIDAYYLAKAKKENGFTQEDLDRVQRKINALDDMDADVWKE